MADEESPLIMALPPNSDYLTYLTIVEYNLNAEALPTLHQVLQEETLTVNIGWDLVHLLVPLLPQSEECLQDIARLGNPREVILKVTEGLRLLEHDLESVEQSNEVNGPNQSGAPSGPSNAIATPETLPPNVVKFNGLLSMLAVLHPRIKTKYPSRFLSTTLQAILASFSNATTYREVMIDTIAKTIRQISGVQRPALPSRKSSGTLSSHLAGKVKSANDPEAVSNVETSAEDSAIVTKLLQAFTTHILEEYLLNLPDHQDIPGMAWSSRLMEKLHGARTIPHTDTFTDRFAREEVLRERVDAVGQLVTLAKDLGILSQELIRSMTMPEKTAIDDQDEDEPPSSAEDIPLSRIGSLFMYAARRASWLLYGRSTGLEILFDIFPQHHDLAKYNLSSLELGAGQLGTEPPVLIDAVLALGLLCLEGDGVGAPNSDTDFTEYLQITAFLSSNCPNPSLRGHAHYLTTTVLRSQPDDNVRLAFIRDTLEHCPFENLKVSAVGWIKGETIEANPPPGSLITTEDSVFAKPSTLETLAPYIFPQLREDLLLADIEEAWTTFQLNVSFYLAGLNFLYLLLSTKHLHKRLAIPSLYSTAEIGTVYLPALLEASGRFGIELIEGGRLADESSDAVLVELQLLNDTVARAIKAAEALEVV